MQKSIHHTFLLYTVGKYNTAHTVQCKCLTGEQSDEVNTETWPSTDVSRFDTYSKGSL